MTYAFSVENLEANYAEIEPLYREHYAEMTARLASQGIEIAPYNPRKEAYFKACAEGWLLNLIVRSDGDAVGYCNVYVSQDMHNGEIVAQEDTVFVTKPHRNGIGRKLVRFGLEELAKRHVKRLSVSAITDARVVPMWKRMGFKEAAVQMIYTFEGN